MDDLIGNLTKRTVTVSQTIENDNVVSDYYYTAVAKDFTVGPGQTTVVGPCSMSGISDPIDIARLGLGQIGFFFTLQMQNLGNAGATVVFALIPNSADQSPVGITELHLSPGESMTINPPQSLTGNVAAISAQLELVFGQVDSNQNVYLAVAVEGGDGSGVLIQEVGIATPPEYLQTQKVSGNGISAYHKDISRVYDPELLGTITNNGAAATEVRLHLRPANATDQLDTPIGLADINPGDSVTGDQLIQGDGYHRIQHAFDKVLNGTDMVYYFTAVSAQEINITSDDLRIQAKVEIKIRPF